MPKSKLLKTPGARNTEADAAPQRLTAGSLKRLSLPTPLQHEGGASRGVVKADADAKSDGDSSGNSEATSVHEDLRFTQSMRREDGPGVLERSLTAAEQRQLLIRTNSSSAMASTMEGTGDSCGPRRNTLLNTRQKDGGLLNDSGEVDLEGHVNQRSPARRLSMPPNFRLDDKDGVGADTSFHSNSTTFHADDSFPMESFQTGDGNMASSSAAHIQRFTPKGADTSEAEKPGLLGKLGRLLQRKSSLLETNIADGGYLDDSGEVDLLSARGRGSSVATSYTNEYPCHPASMTSALSGFEAGFALEAGALDDSLMLSADAMGGSVPSQPSAVSSQKSPEKKKKKEPKVKKEKKELTLEEVQKMLDEDSSPKAAPEPKEKKKKEPKVKKEKKQMTLAVVRNAPGEDSTSQPATSTAANYVASSSQQPAAQPPPQAQMKSPLLEVPVSIDAGSVIDNNANADATVARSGCRKLCCCCH